MPYIRKTTDLFISDSLRNVLQEIRGESLIAARLLSRIPKEDMVDDHIDYLSISDTDITKISYLSKDRISKLEPGKDIWNSSKRFHARPGSVVNKIFKDSSPKDVEIFNNLYKAALTKSEFIFKVVSGEKIRKYYLIDNYRQESGSLGSSCMKYENCQEFFNLYVDNDPIIKMLVMIGTDGLLMGRALLWNFDSHKVMDRIYTINDEEFTYHFKKWAIDNGYMYKNEQKWNSTLLFQLDGKRVEQKFSIKLKNFEYHRYPYLDTFKFLDKKEGILYNYIPNESVKTVSSPDGGYFGHNHLQLDFVTRLYHNNGETVPINYFEGKYIENSDLRTLESSAQWSKVNNTFILAKDCVYSEEIRDFIFNEELDNLNNKELIEQIKLNKKQKKEVKENLEFLVKSGYSTSTAWSFDIDLMSTISRLA